MNTETWFWNRISHWMCTYLDVKIYYFRLRTTILKKYQNIQKMSYIKAIVYCGYRFVTANCQFQENTKSRFGIHKQLSILLTCIILSTTFQALEFQWSEGNHLLCKDKFQVAEIVIAIHFFSLWIVFCPFVWPLCGLFFFDLRILITPLVSSESCYDNF
jgi:uncharacterized membrane protein YciS (DUF1049 family)